MATPDHLFNLRNNFYLGAFQAAINSSDVNGLSDDDAVERDSLVHRCYIALGQLQFVISEIHDSSPTPLQAVKLLALYFSAPDNKVPHPPPLFLLLNFSFPHSISHLALQFLVGIRHCQPQGMALRSSDRQQLHTQARCWSHLPARAGFQ